MTDLPNIRELLLRDGDIDLDDLGGTSDPSTMSRLALSTTGVSGLTSPYVGEPTWITVDEVVGTDLSLNGDDASLIDVNTAGVYAFAFRLSASADSGAASVTVLWTKLYQAVFGLAFVDDYSAGADLTQYITRTVSASFFCAAGEQLQASLNAEVTSGTLGYSVSLFIQRIA